MTLLENPAVELPEEVTRILNNQSVPILRLFRALCELSAAHLDVNRVGVWLLSEDRRSLRCYSLFELDTQTHSDGFTLRTEDFPNYFRTLLQRTTIPAIDAGNDPRTNELADAYITPLGIQSMLDSALIVDGELVGVICHEHTLSVREWSLEERKYVDEMARSLSLRLAEPGVLESVIIRDRSSERMGQLAAGMAHDFRNILTVLMGHVELLRREPRLSVQGAASLRTMLDAIERGAELTNDLTLIARNRPLPTRVIVPSEVIEHCLPMLRSLVAPRHQLVFRKHPKGGRVFFDVSSLERIITNLVVNARDAMPQGGEISIVVEDGVEHDQLGISQVCKRIDVTDQGTGIDPSIIKTIFDPFFTTKAPDKGTGLGLAIVKQLVERAGGEITFRTQVNQGTTFSVYLPLVTNSHPY
ncbi:MAG: ATP-binding protein [Fimbriiglobus sp.]